ncbi:MAG: molybdopterin-dependent oxidoreductase [Solirubrobacterales bacterium]|nr:molybdopterin-dependent oxidoreductase [Solirubrobacterales bacterium]
MAVDEVVLTTCPRDCYDACGVEVVLRAGRIRHVRGDRSHPVSRGRLCVKCATAYNGVLLDPRARLLYPLRRSGPKGAGEFETVSWEQALGEVAERLAALPGETVLNAHYTGTFALLGYHFPQRFFNRLGATEVDPDTICNNAGHVALEYLYGTSLDGFDPRTSRDARCIVVWGANPSASAPHQHDHWLPEAPGQVIVVDPVRTPTATAADLHLAPFPGSDAALAFALGHVIRRDGLLDRELLEDHAIGFCELEPLLEGCTPEWGERITGVPAALIERAARLYGTGPSLLWIGQGFQRQPRGGNAVRAVAQLAAISGNLGKPGTGVLYLNGAGNRHLDEDYVSGAELRNTMPEPVSHMDLAERLEDTALSRALFCWNINIAASNPEQERLHRALAREDLFTVVSDLFATDTTDYADIVLPAASFLESEDLVASYFHLSLSAQVKAIEPLGESLPNTEIFRRLAAAMGFVEPQLQERDADVIARVLKPTGLEFADLTARGTVWLDPEPMVQFADLRFPTPSGRVEIACERAEADGHPRLPEPYADPRPAQRRLRLLSPASAWLLNDSFANDAKLSRRIGAATVTMHPADAADRGLAAGDAVLLESATGQLSLTVALSEGLPRGVVYSPKGRWPKREPGAANVNALNPGLESDMGHSTTVHGTEVTVTQL